MASASEGQGPVRRSKAVSFLLAPWKVVANNEYADIWAVAPSQLPGQSPSQESLSAAEEARDSKKHNTEGNGTPAHSLGPKRKRTPLDIAVSIAGTPFVFFLTVAALLAWAVIGIVLGPSQAWQIALQNVSSLQCYASDTLLMRQQRNYSRDLLSIVCELRSRGAACRRRWESIADNVTIVDPGLQTPAQEDVRKSLQDLTIKEVGPESRPNSNAGDVDIDEADDGVCLPPTSLYDRICDPIVRAFSSLYAWIIFWAGICVWLGFGATLSWANEWQLYINSAVAIELTFVSVFLQNTRKRHLAYLKRCFECIQVEDARLECSLGELTGDDEEPNPVVKFEYDYTKETTRGQRAIDYYAAIVGTGIGVALSAMVIAAWLGIGHLMEWDPNWWLIIGTYTGLVGFVDGFALRNVYFRGSKIVDDQFDVLAKEDDELGHLLGLVALPGATMDEDKNSLPSHIANTVGEWCSHSGAVLGSVVVVVAVLVIATVMHWSETAQLICNTPTMIVEGFLLLVLIQAHNASNTQRRLHFRDALRRRLAMNSHVCRLVVKRDVMASNDTTEE